MTDVVTVKTRKYIRLTALDYATVEPSIKPLLDDSNFVEKVARAYHGQVVCHGGWGFTVRHEGYRIRFDLENSTVYRLPRIYEGYVLEKPNGRQLTLASLLEEA